MIAIKDKSLLEEQGAGFVAKLSDVLIADINALCEAREADDLFLIEVCSDELYSSINADFVAGDITDDEAEYLREKYL